MNDVFLLTHNKALFYIIVFTFPFLIHSQSFGVKSINTISTTNDMPIIYPPTFKAFGWVPFNINPHYLDPISDSTHMGESRETRISEFHKFNDIPVIGLREGSWIRLENNQYVLKGGQTARLFKANEKALEIDIIKF